MDAPHTDEIINLIAGSGVFVVPCVVLDASMMGITGAAFADDPRVSSRLDEAGLATLRSGFDRCPRGELDAVLASVSALRDAGVDIITGSDASVPVPSLGGVAHGASVHHELQYLVRAGLTPVRRSARPRPRPLRRAGSASPTGGGSPRPCAPTCFWSAATPPRRSRTPSTCDRSGGAAACCHSDEAWVPRPARCGEHLDIRPTGRP